MHITVLTAGDLDHSDFQSVIYNNIIQISL